MVDTITPNIKLTNQTEGGNNNSWGTIADANFEEIDDKFGDVTSISTSGGTTTLTDAQEIVNAIVVSGTLSSNATIVFSGRGGSWVVRNDTTGSYSVTCKVSGQTGVEIEQGGAALVFCDGTDIDFANPASSATAEVTVASASTCDILGAGSEFIRITGSTTITSFGTGANRKRFVRINATLTITHNATTLICPGGVNIAARDGDTFLVISDASSNCRIFLYQRAAVPPPSVPIGTVFDYAGGSAPSMWLLCYGQEVSRTTYAALFAVIGTTYGIGDASTTFNIPDMRGRVVAGQDDMGGTSANRLLGVTGSVDGDTLGAVGGSESVTLLTSQMPGHTHTGTTAEDGDHTHTFQHSQDGANAGAGVTVSNNALTGTTETTSENGAHTHTFTTDSTGGGTGHPNVQPTIILNKIIFAGA